MTPEVDDDDAYLWDRSGPPDPEVLRLEELLSASAHHRKVQPVARRLRRRRQHGGRLVAAAAILIGLGLTFTLWRGFEGTADPGPGTRRYRVTGLEDRRFVSTDERIELSEGGAAVRLEIPDLGEVTLDSGARFRVLDAAAGQHRLFLERGRAEALIGPSGANRFAIGTPSGLSVDLGCSYVLDVAEDGGTRIDCTFGIISFEAENAPKVFVPAGARTHSIPGRGPAPPLFVDRPGAFDAESLTSLQFEETPSATRLARIEEAGADADTLPLWHLLRARSTEVRRLAFARLARTYAAPSGVTEEGVLRGDPSMLENWRLDLRLFYW